MRIIHQAANLKSLTIGGAENGFLELLLLRAFDKETSLRKLMVIRDDGPEEPSNGGYGAEPVERVPLLPFLRSLDHLVLDAGPVFDLQQVPGEPHWNLISLQASAPAAPLLRLCFSLRSIWLDLSDAPVNNLDLDLDSVGNCSLLEELVFRSSNASVFTSLFHTLCNLLSLRHLGVDLHTLKDARALTHRTALGDLMAPALENLEICVDNTDMEIRHDHSFLLTIYHVMFVRANLRYVKIPIIFGSSPNKKDKTGWWKTWACTELQELSIAFMKQGQQSYRGAFKKDVLCHLRELQLLHHLRITFLHVDSEAVFKRLIEQGGAPSVRCVTFGQPMSVSSAWLWKLLAAFPRVATIVVWPTDVTRTTRVLASIRRSDIKCCVA